MGWLYNCKPRQTKAEFVAEINRGFSKGYTLLEHRVVGNHLWQLVRREETGKKFIALCLLSKQGGDGWGYKDMTEDMGPYVVDCPLSLLDAADPVTEGHAVEWRAKVRAHHEAKKAKKAALGPDKVVEYGGHKYRLESPAGPRKGWFVTRIDDGGKYRMRAHQLASAQVVA